MVHPELRKKAHFKLGQPQSKLLMRLVYILQSRNRSARQCASAGPLRYVWGEDACVALICHQDAYSSLIQSYFEDTQRSQMLFERGLTGDCLLQDLLEIVGASQQPLSRKCLAVVVRQSGVQQLGAEFTLLIGKDEFARLLQKTCKISTSVRQL